MLLPNEPDTFRLMKEIKNIGQFDAGLIMPDGKIINGNRRRAIKMKLKQKTMIVSILPSTLSPKEIFEIEFGLQVADDFKKEYKGIDKLFMIEQGLKLGKTQKEMKDEFGISQAEVRDAIEIIEKINLFLEFCGREGQYNLVSNMLEHFKDFVKELNKIKKIDGDTFEAEKMFFKLMKLNLDKKDNVVAHRDIRDTLYYASCDPKIREMFIRNIDNEEASEEELLLDLDITKNLARARKENESILSNINKIISQINGINIHDSILSSEDVDYEELVNSLDELVCTAEGFASEVKDEISKNTREVACY